MIKRDAYISFLKSRLLDTEHEDMRFKGNLANAIYMIDDVIVDGGFVDGVRGVEHHDLYNFDYRTNMSSFDFNGTTYPLELKELIAWGTFIVPETKIYLSIDSNKELDSLGYTHQSIFEPNQLGSFFNLQPITLNDFLGNFDFEATIKNNKVSLVDLQGANFGDIESDEFPVTQEGINAIVDRLFIYIDEFFVDLKNQLEDVCNVDEDELKNMNWNELTSKAWQVGYIDYTDNVYDQFLNPECIGFDEELLEQVNLKSMGKIMRDYHSAIYYGDNGMAFMEQEDLADYTKYDFEDFLYDMEVLCSVAGDSERVWTIIEGPSSVEEFYTQDDAVITFYGAFEDMFHEDGTINPVVFTDDYVSERYQSEEMEL